jgi:uncharacterized protein
MNKLENLITILKDMESALLAYSGGVDSTFLLKAMELSHIRTLAVTAFSDITPYADFVFALQTVEEFGIDHMVIETDELLNEEFVKNSPDRCFVCKDKRFKHLTDIALPKGYTFVLDGSNVDDTMDFRPGSKAAEKHNVRSPLIESGFTKQDIRECSKHLGLSTWNKPSSPCLATRFPFGQRITRDSLKRVERAEDFLKSLGFNTIRVRDHGGVARIEVAADKIQLLLVPQTRNTISEHLKKLGYTFISLDLDGYGVRSQHLT